MLRCNAAKSTGICKMAVHPALCRKPLIFHKSIGGKCKHQHGLGVRAVHGFLFSRKSATIEPASKKCITFCPLLERSLLCPIRFSCSADAPLVHTTGGSVRGYRFDGLDIFKGILYAKARRFHAPEPAVWDGVLDATSYGYVCPLLEMPKPNGEMLVPHRYWLMDEACQNLNIWTPALDDAHRPVLVWLHGGGYFAGSSIEQIAYEGETWPASGDCVVVSINHRLNILGLSRPFGLFGGGIRQFRQRGRGRYHRRAALGAG